MDRKAIRHYMASNPELKQWVKDNKDWLKSNPGTVKGIFNQFSYMQSTNQVHSPAKKAVNIRPRRKLLPRIPLPRLSLSNLTNATSQLSKTVHMFDNIQTIMNIMKPK